VFAMRMWRCIQSLKKLKKNVTVAGPKWPQLSTRLQVPLSVPQYALRVCAYVLQHYLL
jgi:hypothetical protein